MNSDNVDAHLHKQTNSEGEEKKDGAVHAHEWNQ